MDHAVKKDAVVTILFHYWLSEIAKYNSHFQSLQGWVSTEKTELEYSIITDKSVHMD